MISTTLVIIGIVVGLALCLPLISQVVQLVAAVTHGRSRRDAPSDASLPPLLFLVPAHNEEGLIGPCVQSLLSMTYPVDRRRVVVIADNCTDSTADRVRELGAECLERNEPSLRGKPRALAWALERIGEIASYDACVVIDADTVVDPGVARALALHAPLNDKAVQAYFGTLNEWDTWLTRLGGVLARGRYEATYPLKQMAGLNCPLTGNGMCIGTALLADRGWDAFSLTENWELYARFTADGTRIDYARDALILSQEARSLNQGGTQRQRWLAGRYGVLRDWWRQIIASERITALQKLDALCELGGLSPVLMLIVAVVLAAGGILLWDVGGWLMVALSIGAIIPQVGTTVRVLFTHPQPGPTVLAFARIPLYAGWRLGMVALTVARRHGGEWRKTDHHQP